MEKLATYIVREGALPAREAAGWIVRLCLTLEPQHASGVAHGRVSAKSIHIESPDSGSRGFLLDAPDLADDPAYFSLDRASGGVRSPESDTWALGVTFYFALTGALPFAGTTADEVRDRLVHSIAAPLAVFDVGDDNLQLLLDQLFSRNFNERLKSLQQVRERLIEWDPKLGQLPALAYGRPDEGYMGIDDDTSDDDDNRMEVTSVAHKALYPELKAEILAQKERRERAADPPAPPSSGPQGGTMVLNEPPAPDPNPELGRTLTSEPDKAPDEPVQILARTLVMSDGDDLARTQVREPRAPPPRAPPKTLPPSRGKVKTPFADTLPAAAIPPEGRAALARAMGKPSAAVRSTVKLGTQPVSPPAGMQPVSPPARTQPVSTQPVSPPAEVAPPPKRSVPPTSGIISGELPSALELLARPDSTPPPPPAPRASPAPLLVPAVPPRRKGGSFMRSLLICLVLVGAGYATFRFYGSAIWRAATRMVPALRNLEKKRRAPSPPPPTATATASAPASAEPSAMLPAASASAAPSDVQACVEPLFPERSFITGQSDMGFLCSETDPAKGAASLHNQIVIGGGRQQASEAMKEWSTLGWYGMAAFAIARTRCCKAAPPLSSPTALKECALDDALTRLGTATFEQSNDAAEQALYAYTRAVKCLVKNGAAQAFGQEGAPKGGEVTTFKKTYERARRLIAPK